MQLHGRNIKPSSKLLLKIPHTISLTTRSNAKPLVVKSLALLLYQGGWPNSRSTVHVNTQERVMMTKTKILMMIKIRKNLMTTRTRMMETKMTKTKMMEIRMTKTKTMETTRTRMTETKMTRTRTTKMIRTKTTETKMTKTRMAVMTTKIKMTKLTLDLKDLLVDITRHGVHHALGEQTQPVILTKSLPMLIRCSFLFPIHRRLHSILLMSTAWEQCSQTKDQRF